MAEHEQRNKKKLVGSSIPIYFVQSLTQATVHHVFEFVVSLKQCYNTVISIILLEPNILGKTFVACH